MQSRKTTMPPFNFIITEKSLRLEFTETPSPSLLKLLQSPDARFTSSSDKLKWERPNDSVWLGRVTALANRFNAEIKDLSKEPQKAEDPKTIAIEPSLQNNKIDLSDAKDTLDISSLFYQMNQMKEEIAELKKSDALASEKLNALKQQLESERLIEKEKPSSRNRSSSKLSGKTKS